jgi:signal transduction histidine kinase/ligand-binding sensor domain-containing protein/DNA-binding response OmpR family regulator
MGLSSNNQRCIIQDKEGFIWIGTGDGLNRFDGRTVKVYRKIQDDTSSLRSNIINCLYTDSEGLLWVGTYQGGLSRYNKEKDNFYTFTTRISDTTALLNNDINAVAEDKFHHLWVGTSFGLYLFHPQTNGFTHYISPTGNQSDLNTIQHNHVCKIAIDNEILWIAYNSGVLTALNTSSMTFKHYKLFDVLSHQTADFSVNSLVVDNNSIWISTWSKGIWVFNKTTGTCSPYTKEKSRYINFVFKDNKDRLWYSPESKGLILIDGKNEIHYQYDDFDRYSVSSNSLSNIFQDIQGNIWLASKQGDLDYFILNNPFYSWYKNPNSTQGLTNNLITTVIEDSKRRIWVGYQDGGIDILDAKKIKPRVHINGDQSTQLGPGAIMYIYESKKGTIWVGKYLDGLKKYNETTRSFSSFQHRENDDNSIAGNDVRYISEDSHGYFWIAIHGGGVDKFNPASGKFVHYRSDPNNPSITISSDWTFIAKCDQENNIWVGSTAGVSVLSENSVLVKHYRVDAKEGYNISNDMVKTIFFDSKGYVWLGTIDGLNKLDSKNNTIRKYFARDGLPGNLIIDILEDNHYNLWISTTNGLSKFFPEKGTFKNYSIHDGLVTDDFNTFASFKIPTGEMYFGGRDGLLRFHPDSIKINKSIPPVYLTDFKLFNQSVSVKIDNRPEEFSLPQQISFCKEINLDYYQNVINLEFVALNYLNLEKNQYRYKLEGFEKDWTFPGYKREVTYTNLQPGRYTFRVIASNNDGIWNTEGASLRIIVHPPFWRTFWAYGFYLLFALFLLYLFRRLILHEAEIKRIVELEQNEIHKLKDMDALKMQFFSNVSHEFRSPLTLIVGPIEKLLRTTKDEIVKSQLNMVYRNANRLLRLINQLMDFRKIEEDKLELNLTNNDVVRFINEIVGAFNQDAKQRNIDFTYQRSHASYKIWFDVDKLDKIIYNLLSNAFKYTPDNGRIAVSVDFNKDGGMISNQNREMQPSGRTFKVTIKDSGIGIPKEAQSRVFDRFYQVKNTLTTQGTGIGLSLTYELVKLHKGNITIESAPNQGSEFSVILPIWTKENELPHLSSIQNETGIKGSTDEHEIFKEDYEESTDSSEHRIRGSTKFPLILIIEDNADMRLFIKNEFRDDYNVIEAHNGNIGLDKAFNEMPDAIICDVMMPGIDGYGVCSTIKHDERTSHIPIIMLTAKSSEQHTIEGLESGADDYIAKPFSSAILRVRIKNLIESRILLRKKFVKEPFATLKDISPSKTDEKLFKKAYAIVENNLDNPNFEVTDFAHEIGMSRTQLYRKIHAISGQSVKEFIRIIRLKKAAELLLTQEKNITEIAYTVGFNSLSYFTMSFTEYFGMNPTKYIEKYIK